LKISVILAHPYNQSFNAAIAAAVADRLKSNGHTVFFHDLYAEGFDPVMKESELVSDAAGDWLIAAHQQEIRESEGIVIIHPNWWGQPPAVLTGWADRVLREKVAYAFAEGDDGEGGAGV
jgi:putative NADPH-quinone reductase